MTVTPYGANGGFVDPIVSSTGTSGSGATVFNIVLSDTTPGETNQDNAFMFTAIGAPAA
jgi:hypothetical protein